MICIFFFSFALSTNPITNPIHTPPQHSPTQPSPYPNSHIYDNDYCPNPTSLNKDTISAKWNEATTTIITNLRIKELFTFPDNPEATAPPITDTVDTLPTGDDIFVEPSAAVGFGNLTIFVLALLAMMMVSFTCKKVFLIINQPLPIKLMSFLHKNALKFHIQPHFNSNTKNTT